MRSRHRANNPTCCHFLGNVRLNRLGMLDHREHVAFCTVTAMILIIESDPETLLDTCHNVLDILLIRM